MLTPSSDGKTSKADWNCMNKLDCYFVGWQIFQPKPLKESFGECDQLGMECPNRDYFSAGQWRKILPSFHLNNGQLRPPINNWLSYSHSCSHLMKSTCLVSDHSRSQSEPIHMPCPNKGHHSARRN